MIYFICDMMNEAFQGTQILATKGLALPDLLDNA